MQAKKKMMQYVFSTKKLNLILLVVGDGFIVMLFSEVAHEVCAEVALLINGDFICTFFPQFTSKNNTEDQCGFHKICIIITKISNVRPILKSLKGYIMWLNFFACIYSSYSFIYVTFP